MKLGPGEYVPDRTEGITRVENLPPSLHTQRSRNYPYRPCPHCRRSCYRHAVGHRTLHDLGCPLRDQPRLLHVTYSRHYCAVCKLHFSADLSNLAPPGSHYTNRVIDRAVHVVVEDGLPYRAASWHLWRDHRVFVPFPTIQNWVEAAGKKGRAAS
jgi:transposase